MGRICDGTYTGIHEEGCAAASGPRVTIGLPGDNLGTPLVVPGERRLRSVDAETEVVDDPDAGGLAALIDREVDAANAAADRAERCLDLHGYGCDRAECGRAPVAERDVRGLADYLGPATSADLLELDAVPDPVDSDSPVAAYASGVGPDAITARLTARVRRDR